ncbi:MAG: CbiX/SirB N-terminal domain-containing protein [Actinomycetia bacterium]|nr:CbiX/SirB N-terminal domain-containing protein [Actinomycetes bacterium]
METVLAMAKAKLPGCVIECAFMEFSDRTVEKGVAALVAQGVTDIKFVPYFLFMGNHLKLDIPEMIAECTEQFPGISITLGEVLGADERLADALVDRIKG